ncbi:MAG: terpene cyclase/mutase family protein, partial [Kiritimatiellaeota bacterium]|nr:terpene cyclase/mutase family protein [Kiritimatiellota bacterium]
MKKLLSPVSCLLSLSLLHAAPPSGVPDFVDESIENGLRFLVAGQLETGRFNSDLGRQGPAVSGLAGMAFLAKGYLPGEGEYGETINRCIDAVLGSASTVNPVGYMGGGHQNPMYSHAICTLFLGEVSHMVDPVRQELIDKVLPNATKIIIDAQNVNKDQNNKGGWRYHPNSGDSDLSCSGWNLMALRSARLSGAPVPPSNIEEAVKYLLRRHNEQSGSFGYQDNASYAVTLSGAAILCLALCGQHDNPAIARGVRYLMTVYNQLPNQERTFYGMY